MYIRKVTQKNKATGKTYTTYRLVESYRTANNKVRQQVLMNLGSHFTMAKEKWKLLADRIEEICSGQQTLLPLDKELEYEAQRIAKLVTKKYSQIQEKQHVNQKASTKKSSDYQSVDIESLQHHDVRKIGAEYVGLHAAEQLQLMPLLRTLGFNQKQVNTALGTIISRLVHPGSELSTHRYLSKQSALDELLDTDFSSLPLQNLYKISDQLHQHKEEIESKLYQREKDFFNLEEIVTLYDMTNTYFEGRSLDNPKAQYGRSKEKRTDCRLVTLGLVLDSSGFPKRSEMYAGNMSEPKTLQAMLEKITTTEKVTLVMDAGIATKENIAWLKSETTYDYIVVSREAKSEYFEDGEAVIIKEDRNNRVKAVLRENKDNQELELYCHSSAKEQKEKELQNKQITRYETELEKLKAGITKKRGLKKYKKVLEKFGRLKEKYRKVSKCFEVNIEKNEHDDNTKLVAFKRAADFQRKPGVYCLRTNRKDLDEQTFWNIYVMLTDVEAAFRHLKSELGFRPIYHQKEHRVDGHLFISIIAYHLLHTIRYQLKLKGIHASWNTLREILSTQCRITSTMQLENGKVLQIRKTTSPDVEQQAIYEALTIDTHPGKTEKSIL